MMTLEQIAAYPKEVLTCQQVAPVLQMSPTTLHEQAIEMPWLLGFPVIVTKRRVKIPRRAFLKYMEGN